LALDRSNGSAVLDFFRYAASAESLEGLSASFALAANENGFERASCIHIATPGRPVAPRVLFGWNMSDWVGHYTEARLSRYDPTIQAVFTSPSAFSWAEIEERHPDKSSRTVFDQARSFGAKGGLVVPVHGPQGEVLAVTLVSEQYSEFDHQSRMTMQVASTIFASRGLALVEIERETSTDPSLTRREIQCVYWVNEGKTDWEIGRILDISEDTVAFHLKNVKTKLNVTRRSQIPIQAWLRGVLLDERP
jgi:LuxR family transcriptional regulator, activator of conjugal transfer of Ti plasmids